MDTTGDNNIEWVKLISESQIFQNSSYLLFLDLIYTKKNVCMYVWYGMQGEVKLSKGTIWILRK